MGGYLMALEGLIVYTSKVRKVISLSYQKELLTKILIENESFIINLQQGQLLKGVKADGSDMPEYVEGSKHSSATGKWDFYDKGDFYKGMDAIFENDGFMLDSTDNKTDVLIKMAGEEIFGLNEDSIKKLTSKIKPILIEANRTALKSIAH